MIEGAFTEEEVAKHCTKEDLWIIIEGGVYDVTSFVKTHPGGEDVLLLVAGEDATSEFHKAKHSIEAKKVMERFYIGTLIRDCILECDGLLKPRRVQKRWIKYLRTMDISSLDSFHWCLLLIGIISVLFILIQW
eukprot:jgi/Galph1/2994/GphlegSOOS_G1668.1